MTRLQLTTALPTPATTVNDAGSVNGPQAAAREAAAKAVVPGREQARDQASLSTAGGIVAEAFNGSDVRTAKIAALQQSIAAGTYNISASDVADKLIGSLLGGR